MSYTPNSVNEAYWRKYTEEASEFYKTKMLGLGTMKNLEVPSMVLMYLII